jgi:hypothetical protein
VRSLIALAIASGMAYVANRYLVSRLGTIALITLVPPLEELLKTGATILLQASIWWVHLGFGLLEAAVNLGRNPRSLPEVGFLAAIGSIVGHAAFGVITLWGQSRSGHWLGGLALGSGLHLLWNMWVVRLSEC